MLNTISKMTFSSATAETCKNNVYKNPEIRIKNKMKRIICENCGFLSRYKF